MIDVQPGPLCGLLCVGLVIGAGVALGLWNLRRVGSRKKAEAVPPEVVERVLSAIDAVGNEGLVLLRPGGEGPSRLGGLPRVAAWPGRCVHLGEIDGVSAFADPDQGEVLALEATGAELAAPRGVKVLPERKLRPVRLPGSYLPAPLLKRAPGVRELLQGFGDAPERLLPHLLMPGIGTHEIDGALLVLKGAKPELIQQPHGAKCPICSAALRFLFQVGDVFGPELTLGDAAVVYVYRCAAHPSQLGAFIDSH